MINQLQVDNQDCRIWIPIERLERRCSRSDQLRNGRCARIADTEPDDFRRKPSELASVEKVTVLGDDGVSSVLREIPNAGVIARDTTAVEDVHHVVEKIGDAWNQSW